MSLLSHCNFCYFTILPVTFYLHLTELSIWDSSKRKTRLLNWDIGSYDDICYKYTTLQANLATWEPAHGCFKFQHPWKQYLKVGASTRRCAYCIETLSGFIDSEDQAPELVKKHFKEVCMKLSSCSSRVLRELATTMRTMTKSTKTESFIQDMNASVQIIQNMFKDLSNQAILLAEHEKNSRTCKGDAIQKTDIVPIMERFPIATIASLLIEISERVQNIVIKVDEVAVQAEFEVVIYKKKKVNETDI
ncbi:aluminum-activated malate transporter 10-like [Rutidosis leptorrhynchoides]|uniref:aluminum-activated malate transporter 10-like n=1 Tax=Rutidosis leptorrhynchoides TaxID=125765 RepID=UPI003A99C004